MISTTHSSKPMPDQLENAYLSLRGDVRKFVARRVPSGVVDDLTQEIFLKMHEHAGELRDVTRLAPWLFRITRNVVTDHLRRKRATSEPLDEESLEGSPVPEHDTEQQQQQQQQQQLDQDSNFNAELGRWLLPMMKMLPEEYRVALELTEVEGITQRELAERSGLSLSGAKSRVQRAKQMLEGIVRACCDFEVDTRGNVLECSPRVGGPCKSC